MLILASSACMRPVEEFSIIPPPTFPLSRPVIGYGVVLASYTNLGSEPRHNSFSQGYMRRGAIVKVLERRAVKKQDAIESWVLVEGGYSGWLPEAEVGIYENEAQAETASDKLGG